MNRGCYQNHPNGSALYGLRDSSQMSGRRDESDLCSCQDDASSSEGGRPGHRRHIEYTQWYLPCRRQHQSSRKTNSTLQTLCSGSCFVDWLHWWYGFVFQKTSYCGEEWDRGQMDRNTGKRKHGKEWSRMLNRETAALKCERG
jgi:hypothetical protein